MSATTLTIELDGLPYHTATGTTLAQLVARLGHLPTTVTTAVNGEFVARVERSNRVLQNGDAVLLFQPIVGG